MLKKIFCAILAIVSISCTQTGVNSYRTIPYVNEILSGSVPGLGALGNSSLSDRNRILYIFGDSSSCACLRDSMLVADRFDNASGAVVPDLLPDFAGETLACVYDTTGLGYRSYMAERDTSGLRKFAVDMLLAAVDTTFKLSLYDIEGLGRKLPAKIIMFTDPWVAVHGKFDIDTLISATSCPISVVVPLECAFENVLKDRVKAPSVAVVTDADSSCFDVYSELFTKLCEKKSLKSGHCSVFASSDRSTLRTYMESYIESGDYHPLDAVIFDCRCGRLAGFSAEYSKMTSVMHEEYMRFGHLFAEDFRFVSAISCAVDRCYSIMRERNIFSHDIYQPRSVSYWMVSDSDKSSISIAECIR